MADFMKSLRDTPYGGSAKKPPSSASKHSHSASRGADRESEIADAAPHSNRKLQYKGSHTMTPSKPTQAQTPPPRPAPKRTTTPCVPPEAALTIQHTPRQGSMGRRQDSGGEDKQQRDQEAKEQQQDASMSPRDSDDGIVNLDDTTIEGAEGESVQVLVRIRPHNLKELQLGDDSSCLTLLGTRAVTCTVPGRDPRTFTFDNVLFGPQTEVFEVSGMPMVDNCMSGYNSSIFAYGQTGAGKTHTMLGQIDKSKSPSERGLAPRVFDYLFQKIGEEEDAKGRDSLRYSCRCSFLEIYNETITDLLNPSATNLQIREDTHGCFVEYLTETEVLNVDDVLTLMRHGAENRHTGETRLNRESSRSHSVFTCTVEKTSKASNGVTSVICSRLNLIDLAGSERVHGGALGGSHAVGNHFKEAVHINKSLTTLGRVIMELVEAQRSGRLGRHIPYRDSRLTFLLQDSLGGNAKTQIIANVSPSTICSAETLSTLYFVQRAKCIRNKATINLDYRGDTKLLQTEILRLNTEISNLKSGITEPAIQENTDLRIRLDKEERRVKELELKLSSLVTANNQFKRERERLEERMTSTQVKNKELQESLSSRVDTNKKMAAAERSYFEHQIAALTDELQSSKAMVEELQASADAQSQEAQEAQAALDTRIAELQQQIAQLQVDHESEMAARKQAADAEIQELQERLDRVEQERESSSMEAAQLQEQLEEVEAAKEAAAEMVEDQRQHIGKLKQDLAALQEESSASTAELQASLQSLTHEKAALEQAVERQGAEISSRSEEASELQAALGASQAESRSLEEQLQGSQGQVAQLTEELQASLEASAKLNDKLQASQGAGAEVREQLEATQSRVVQLEREVEAGTQGADSLQELLRERNEVVLKLEGQVKEGQQGADQLQQQLVERREEVVKLEERVQEGEQSARVLQQQLQASREEVARMEGRVQAGEEGSAGLLQQLAESQGLSGSLAEQLQASQATSASLSEQLHSSQAMSMQLAEDKARLEGELAASQQAVATLTDELQAAVAKLAKEKGQLAEDLADSQASSARLAEERAQLTEELQGSRAEATRLAEERAQLSEELGMTKGQLAAREEQMGALRNQLEGVESQAHSLSQQVAAQQKDIEDKQAGLEQVEQQLSEARSLVSAREADVANLERAAKETEMQTHVSSKEQQSQIATLQKEIIRSQEEYVVHEYELKGVAKGLEDELEALRKDQAHAQAMLESKDAELAQLQRCLAEQASSLEKAQATIAAREKELQELQASTKEAMAKAQQLHESEQAYIRELQKELNAFKLGRGDMEQQMKNFLITNTRQGRAFTEIRRLIEWATTPPSSARASIGTRNQGGAPMIGSAENGGGGSPATAAPADGAAADKDLSPTKVSMQMGSAPSPNTGDEEVGCDTLYQQEPGSDAGSNNGDADEQPDVVQREQSHPPSGHKWHKRGEAAVYSDVDSPLDQAVHAHHV